MTRFARAKGSKASNEKAPEDSTPWEVMKEQLLQSKKDNEEIKNRQAAEKQRLENYQNFLNEQKTQKRKATWCEFPTAEKKDETIQPVKKKKNSKKEFTPKDVNTEDLNTAGSNSTNDNVVEIKKKKKNKAKANSSVVAASSISDVNMESTDGNKNKDGKEPKKIKIKSKDVKVSNESRSDQHNSNNIIKDNGPINKSLKHKKRNKEFKNGKPVRRKEINDNSFQLIINGKEVELVRFDGFPIMKKDAERLHELKNNMIKKGIPKSEVQRTMKLERRRAEKALARLKRDVCYNCRKGGHNLSDCPDLKSKLPGGDAADGVCFKCGSTEHKQFECKVQKNMEFKFATCFICKQAGHIARQCPDNPKGLYPNGGSCKLCGDVTHLRKDCPTTNTKKEETSIKLSTLDVDNIEDIAQQSSVTAPQQSTKKPKKIKF